MLMLNGTDGRVLEITGEEGVIYNRFLDHTRVNQHSIWYMYPLHIDSKEEEIYTILSRKNQKALLWDGHILAVKPYDSSDEAQQWTLDGEFFILPKKNKCSWSLKVKASIEVCVSVLHA